MFRYFASCCSVSASLLKHNRESDLLKQKIKGNSEGMPKIPIRKVHVREFEPAQPKVHYSEYNLLLLLPLDGSAQCSSPTDAPHAKSSPPPMLTIFCTISIPKRQGNHIVAVCHDLCTGPWIPNPLLDVSRWRQSRSGAHPIHGRPRPASDSSDSASIFCRISAQYRVSQQAAFFFLPQAEASLVRNITSSKKFQPPFLMDSKAFLHAEGTYVGASPVAKVIWEIFL